MKYGIFAQDAEVWDETSALDTFWTQEEAERVAREDYYKVGEDVVVRPVEEDRWD